MSQPNRRALDDVVFDVLGLTAGVRKAACLPKLWRRRVDEAVIALVRLPCVSEPTTNPLRHKNETRAFKPRSAGNEAARHSAGRRGVRAGRTGPKTA